MYEDEPPKPALWDNPEGWGAEGGGKRVQDGGNTVIALADSCRCMAKPTAVK